MFLLASLPALLPQQRLGAAVGAQAIKSARARPCNAICVNGKGETGLAASSFHTHHVTTLLPDKGGQIPQLSPEEPGNPTFANRQSHRAFYALPPLLKDSASTAFVLSENPWMWIFYLRPTFLGEQAVCTLYTHFLFSFFLYYCYYYYFIFF